MRIARGRHPRGVLIEEPVSKVMDLRSETSKMTFSVKS